MARGKKAAAGIQQELIEDARQTKRVPAALKKLLEPLCETIYNAAVYKQQENEYKDQCMELMAKHELSEVELPNGGKLLYKPGKPSVQYVSPKASKVVVGEGEEEGNPEFPEEE